VATGGASNNQASDESVRCFYLFVSLLALLLASPLFDVHPRGQIFTAGLNTATIVAGVYAVAKKRSDLMVALALAIPQLLLAWIAIATASPGAGIASVVLLVAFYAYAAARVLGYVASGEEVTTDRIFGAISVYLLMGLGWASTYFLLELLRPGSFFIDPIRNPTGGLAFPQLVYMSFATLTTLGYGDVTPVSGLARVVASLEAVAGVLYLAVLVSRLVSLYKPASR